MGRHSLPDPPRAGAADPRPRARADEDALAAGLRHAAARLLRHGTGQPKRNQALILTEQAAFAHSATAGLARRLDLFCPKDGSPALDYPCALVDDPSRIHTVILQG